MVKKKNKTKSSRMAKVAASVRGSSGGDISNRTVMIVLVVVILVSVMSIAIYMQALESVKPKVLVNGGVAQGEVKLTLVPPIGSEEEKVEVEKPATSQMDGQVALTILPSK